MTHFAQKLVNQLPAAVGIQSPAIIQNDIGKYGGGVDIVYFDSARSNIVYGMEITDFTRETLERALAEMLVYRVCEWDNANASEDIDAYETLDGYGVFMVFGSMKPTPAAMRMVKGYGLEYVQVVG